MPKATVHVSTTQGSVGAHFSVYNGPRFIPVPIPTDKRGGYVTIPIPVGSNFTKLASRDDDSNPNKITPNNPWDETVNIANSGTYILDLSDWINSPNVSVELKIDGAIVWKASGNTDNYDGWTIIERATNVRVTDDREIAVAVD